MVAAVGEEEIGATALLPVTLHNRRPARRKLGPNRRLLIVTASIEPKMRCMSSLVSRLASDSCLSLSVISMSSLSVLPVPTPLRTISPNLASNLYLQYSRHRSYQKGHHRFRQSVKLPALEKPSASAVFLASRWRSVGSKSIA